MSVPGYELLSSELVSSDTLEIQNEGENIDRIIRACRFTRRVECWMLAAEAEP
ncbi:MAG TPA: hypothetical protein VE842_17940 [Pyrinomonadaceae bacterium]|nr:hypothetical protein [Pyrinomonadaceae bacterium]